MNPRKRQWRKMTYDDRKYLWRVRTPGTGGPIIEILRPEEKGTTHPLWAYLEATPPASPALVVEMLRDAAFIWKPKEAPCRLVRGDALEGWMADQGVAPPINRRPEPKTAGV